jgi:NTP pyrophosphatase (non-canonical NTP hydrolase)
MTVESPIPTESLLSFSVLRKANLARMPLFKNRIGGPAHSKPDGSDWNPASWLQALVGELGEYARARHLYENGEMSYDDYVVEAQKELADVQCYLDLLAARALDKVDTTVPHQDSAQAFQQLVAGLGEYANWRKKFERGDMPVQAFTSVAFDGLVEVAQQLPALYGVRAYKAQVTMAHATGVDLGAAVTDKFNEVSARVGAPVHLVGNTVELG